MSPVKPVRYAVVGLGHIARVAVLSAVAHARRNSTLVAVVSDDRTKRREIAERYQVETPTPTISSTTVCARWMRCTSRRQIQCTAKAGVHKCAKRRWRSPCGADVFDKAKWNAAISVAFGT